MNKEFVPYGLAVKLKELGFDEPCFGYYYSEDELIHNCHTNNYMQRFRYSAPTFSQAFRWFREKYNLLGTPQYFTGGFYCYTINDMKDSKESNRLFTEYETYEEAELECLKKLIEIVKNGK